MRCILNNLEAARKIIHSLEDKKAENIVLLDIHELVDFTDYFIICSGTSNRMLASLATTAFETSKYDLKIKATIEGQADSGWILIDSGDIIIHIFSPDQRDYYQLEKLWSNGKILVHIQ